MSGLAALLLVAAAEVSASVSSDVTATSLSSRSTRVSSAPVGAVSLQPSATLTLPGREWQLSASYSPRANFRLSRGRDPFSPLFLHQISLRGDGTIGRNRLNSSFTLLVGEVDFSTANLAFGDTQNSLPLDPNVVVVTGQGRIGWSRAVAARTTLTASMVGTDQRLLQQSTALGLLFRNTSTVGATVGVAERMTSRDDLTLDVGPSLVFFDTSTNLQTSATVGWGHTLTPTYQTQLSLGGGRTDLVGAELDPRRVVPLRRDPLYFGLANASITRSTPGGDDTVRFGTNARVDPVLQTIRPQISLDVTSTRRLAGGLSISGSGVASTVASQTPLPSDPDETGVQLRLTLAWAVDAFSFRLNAAAVGRGPHLARGFEIRQRSLSGGFGVTWSFL